GAQHHGGAQSAGDGARDEGNEVGDQDNGRNRGQQSNGRRHRLWDGAQVLGEQSPGEPAGDQADRKGDHGGGGDEHRRLYGHGRLDLPRREPQRHEDRQVAPALTDSGDKRVDERGRTQYADQRAQQDGEILNLPEVHEVGGPL